MKLEPLFADSFDTFKVFDKLDAQQASLTNNNSPSSIWQILNHLIIWQDFQLNKLVGNQTTDINEIDTWQVNRNIADQNILNENITKFKNQIEEIKLELSKLELE